jgi:hypothetical protein
MPESTRTALLDEWAQTVHSVRERGDTND